MVNFNDPAEIARDVGACPFLPLSRTEKLTGPTSQRYSRRFCVWWMVSSCGSVSRYNALHNSTSYSQLGVYDHSWLRVEYHPRACPIQVDDMGL
jgi:hypothetical protein